MTLAILRRFWPHIAVGVTILGLALALFLTRATLDRSKAATAAEKAAHAITVANYRAASEKWRADELARATALRNQYDTISQEKQNALETQLADARAVAADYARRMRPGAPGDGQGNPGGASGAAVPYAAGGSLAAGGDAVVPADDLRICAANTILAQGWQSWYASVKAVPR